MLPEMAAGASSPAEGFEPLSKIAIHKATVELQPSAFVQATPSLLGDKGEDTDRVTVKYGRTKRSVDDWIAVFSPADFNSGKCPNPASYPGEPLLCTAPMKYQYANYSARYTNPGDGSIRFQLIDQRADFAFALFTGGLENARLVAVSKPVAFRNPKAPVFPRLAHGKIDDEIAVTWTSGYDIAPVEKSRAEPANIEVLLQDRARAAGRVCRVGQALHVPCSAVDGAELAAARHRLRRHGKGGEGRIERVRELPAGITEHDGRAGQGSGQLRPRLHFTVGPVHCAGRAHHRYELHDRKHRGNHERDWPNTGGFFDVKDSSGECGVLAGPRPCTTTRQRTEPTSGTRWTTGCFGSASPTQSTIGGRARSSTSSSSTAS
ncbi:hypothetical protein SEVIR_6G229901v4 [Setaria viridis]|nr:uncharacterized protein LOC117860479 isoform X3 [Setaria viridis]